ncbi:MAG: MarR family winged helix-turn-helix transcriptional regulator [Candidatus Dormibacterales bacterium]
MATKVDSPPALGDDVRAALVAYLEAVALSEPIQAQLWQQARLTLTQLTVLRQLRGAPLTAGRLGQAVGLSPTSVTRLLDRLEERRLVSRRRGPEDRRCVEVHLEPAGLSLLGEARVVLGSDLHRAVESMTGAERGQLVAALGALVDRARAAEASR